MRNGGGGGAEGLRVRKGEKRGREEGEEGERIHIESLRIQL